MFVTLFNLVFTFIYYFIKFNNNFKNELRYVNNAQIINKLKWQNQIIKRHNNPRQINKNREKRTDGEIDKIKSQMLI